MEEVRSTVCVHCETHFTYTRRPGPGRPRSRCDACRTPKASTPRQPRATAPCGGGCGKTLVESSTSLPAGQRTCNDCRRAAWATECVGCGDPIPEEKRSKQRKYCSLDCFNGGHIAGTGAVIGGHRHRARGTANCAWCRAEFDWHPRYRATYCSNDCRQADRFKKTCEIPWGQCANCDSWFVRRGNKSYCREACRPVVSYYEPKLRRLTCEYCGDEFEQQWGRTRRHCDDWCKSEAEATPLEIRGCEVCGVSFMAYSQQLYCSADCRPYDSANIPDATRQYIYERDGYRCHLCGTATDATVEPHHRLAPTLDHLIPKSLGGTHEVNNLRCAHRHCNSSKGTRAVGEQLLLVG